MKKMKRKGAIACALLLSISMLAGCGTNVGTHSSTYWTQMKYVLTTAMSSNSLIKAAESASSTTEEEVDENAISSPENFVVNEDGTYSFDAVENAQYYIVYVYDSESSVDASYTSEKIYDDGSDSYSGTLSDLGNFTYQTWSVRVVAYPDYDNTDYTASASSRASYVVTGAVEYCEPTVGYLWFVGTNKLEIKLEGLDYSMTSYPTSIVLTLTNTADSSDVITAEMDDIDDSSVTIETEDVTAGATYSITADFTWDEEYVTNPSYSTEIGEIETDAENNAMSDTYYYSSSIYYNFDYPHYYEGFDLEEGGLFGIWVIDPDSVSTGGWGWMMMEETTEEEDDEEKDYNCYFYATPTDTEDGALYTYTVMVTSPEDMIYATPLLSPDSSNTERLFGYLNIYEDGTFSVEIEYQYISYNSMNAAVNYVPGTICYGTYTTNSDGTINLSFDHENTTETEYDVVMELTGQAAEYEAANSEETEAE